MTVVKATLPVSLRAIITGLLVGLAAANVWPPLLVSLGVPLAATAETVWRLRLIGSPRSSRMASIGTDDVLLVR